MGDSERREGAFLKQLEAQTKVVELEQLAPRLEKSVAADASKAEKALESLPRKHG